MAGQCAFHCIVSVLVSHLLFCSGISELDFTIEPHDVVALQEESLLWECEVTGQQPIQIIWRYNGVEITSTSQRIILGHGPLWFEEVVAEDTGHYQCCARNNVGTLCSRTVELKIATLSIPEVRLSNRTIAVTRDNARLVCDVEAYPKPQVIWFKDEERLVLDDFRFTALEPGILQISDVDDSDAGEYWCSAINVQGNSTSDSFQLNITTLAELPIPLPQTPMIVAAPQNATVIAGTSMHTFECAVSLWSLRVKWTRKDGRSIPQNRHEIVGFGNLQLTDIHIADRGLYICTVTNPENSSMVQQAKAWLTVIDPPVFTYRPVDSNKPEVTKVRLECRVNGFPTPEVTWVYNGEVIDITKGRNQQVESNNDLVIWNSRDKDSGIYQCVARNAGGEIRASAVVTVVAPDNRPQAPYNLSAVAINSRSIIIKWTPPKLPPNQTLEAYTLHYYKTGGREELLPAGKDATSMIVPILDPYTNYTFYMKSYINYMTQVTASLASQTVTAMTLEGKPSCAPMFRMTSNTPNTIEINWQAVAQECRNGVILRYRYCYRQTGHKTYQCREVQNVNRTRGLIRQLQPSTVYSVSMAVATVMGFGADSVWDKISTLDVRNCKVPTAYTLEWSIVNSSLVEVFWRSSEPLSTTPVNISINGFALIVTNREDENKETVMMLGPDERTHTFSDLEPGANYDVELYAYNDCGNGQEWLEELSIPSLPGAEDNCTKMVVSWPPPYNMQTTGVSASSIDIQWNPPDGNITPDFYCITYKKLERGVKEEQKAVYSSTAQVSVYDLKPFSVYNFTIQAVIQAACRNIFSKSSQPGYIRTLPDEPSVPQQVGASALDSHTVAVIWGPPKNPNGIIASYMILYSEDKSQPETVWNMTERNADTYTDIIEDLSSNTKYYFRVRASNEAGTGPASSPVEAKTPPKLDVLVPPDTEPRNIMDNSLEKGILASIVLVTFFIIACTVVVICRERINKRNRRQEELRVSNGPVGSRQGYPYNANRPNGQQTQGGMDMEMSPMLPGNRYHGNIQGSGTPDRHVCNGGGSNYSPHSVRDLSQQGTGNSTNHRLQNSCVGFCRGNIHHHDNQQQNPSSSSHQHHHLSNQDAPRHNNTSSYNDNTLQYLPGYQFNSGQSSPRISGQSSPHQLQMDQDIEVAENENENNEQSVLKSREEVWQEQEKQLCERDKKLCERDELRLNLPYTLSTSLATTSCTGISPAGSHHPQLPPQTNHREEGATAAAGHPDVWSGGGDDSHHPLSCGESTGGDSGMIEDVDWDTQDTSPDFVDKALMEVSGDASLYVV